MATPKATRCYFHVPLNGLFLLRTTKSRWHRVRLEAVRMRDKHGSLAIFSHTSLTVEGLKRMETAHWPGENSASSL